MAGSEVDSGALVSCSSSSPNWALLPTNMLDVIMSKLSLCTDLIRFGAVCREWSSLALQKTPNICQKNPPMLLLPTKDENGNGGQAEYYGRLYSIWEQKLYNCRLPLPYKMRCCGSSHGWLARAEHDFSITLFNPFSAHTIHLRPIVDLPSIHGDGDDDQDHSSHKYACLPDFEIPKVILSEDPSANPHGYIVVAVYSTLKKLAFIKSGETCWTFVGDYVRPVWDVIFYKGKLYVVKGRNQLLRIETETSSSSSESLDDSDEDEPYYEIIVSFSLKHSLKLYLVESLRRDLLLIRRDYWDEKKKRKMHYGVTVGFKIYKLVMINSSDGDGRGKWVEIDSLDGEAIFIGDNRTECISASDFPNCQSNSIYYTDDCWERTSLTKPCDANDMGVYDFNIGVFGKFYNLLPSDMFLPPATWIIPSSNCMEGLRSH